MRVSTSEESTFNNLAVMELAVQRHLEAARADHHWELAAHLEALIAQVNITKAAALDAAGGKRGGR
jgi:hypothetical protein